MKKLILLFAILFAIDSQDANAQEPLQSVEGLFKVHVTNTIVSTRAKGAVRLNHLEGKLQIRVYSMNGQLLASFNDWAGAGVDYIYSVDFSNFSTGIYVIDITYEDVENRRDKLSYKVKKY